MSTSAITRQTVTIDGNLIVHGRTGINLPLVFQDKDGLPKDSRTRVLWFEVQGLFRVQMPAYDVADPVNVRYLRISAALAGLLPAKENRVSFILRDETDALIPEPVWTGKVWADGFAVEPPVLP